MKSINSMALVAALVACIPVAAEAAPATASKPTVVLVHGAFADATSWNGVVAKLRSDGYRVIGAANPLRSVQSDAASIASIVKSVNGPVLLVGHSYGGSVISEAAYGQANVRGLVYVAAFAPELGEAALELSGRFPGSTLAGALAQPVILPDGGQDLYIDQAKFHAQFAADVPQAEADLMAVAQRPVAQAALTEASTAPAWKQLPSYFIYGSEDKCIPAAVQAFMAKRAHARRTVVIPGASHVVMTSHPSEVAALIEAAAQAN